MPEFTYRAMDQRRRWLRGRLRAANEFELDQRLRDRGLDLITCKVLKAQRGMSLLTRRVKQHDLTELCIHLEQMNNAGVPLLESLAEARDSIGSPRLQDVLTEVHRDVNQGVPLSQAFAAHPKVFDVVFISLIEAGEATGNLTDSFRELVRHLKWSQEMTTRVKKATRYPMVLGVAVIIVLLVMMALVVPQVVELLRSLRTELPIATVALITVSQVFQDYWYLILLAPPAVAAAVRMARELSADFALRVDSLTLRLPVVGETIKKMNFARFAHILAATFRSGIDVLGCLETAGRMVRNRSLRQAVDVVSERVQVGEPLSLAMHTTGEFSPMVIHMVRVGENSGNLVETLDAVAQFYDRDVNDAVDGMIAMIEPALIVLMGGMMAWIALAVFGPIYSNISVLG